MALNEKPSTSDIILATLIKNHAPMNLYQLAKKSNLSNPRVRYAIPKLIEQGLIIPIKNDNGLVYVTQPIHTDQKLIDSILVLIEPMVKKIYSELDLDCVEDHEEALANNLALFILKQVILVK